MDSYISQKYTILDGTLLALSDESEDLVIPAEVEGHRIKRIGPGVCGNKKLRTVRIEEGIEEIGNNAFFNCESVRRVDMPTSLKYCERHIFNNYFVTNGSAIMYLKRRFDREEYEIIRENSIQTVNGLKLLNSVFGKMPAFTGILNGFESCRVPMLIDPGMLCLYSGKIGNLGLPKQFPFQNMWEEIDTHGMYRESQFRDKIAERLVKMKAEPLRDPKSEDEHDSSVRMNRLQTLMEVALVYYRDSESVTDDDGIVVNFHIRFGKTFFPVINKVIYSGKVYYIYSERYLCGPGSINFAQMDYYNMIYDEDGNRLDSYPAAQVVGKYRMMSMII